MKVLMIAVPLMDRIDGHLYPISMDRIRSSPPLGVYWLAGLLRQRGHEVDVLDLIAEGELDEKLILERAGKSDLCGISSNSMNWPTALTVVRMIKAEYSALPIVMGGIHPTNYSEHVFKTSDADYIIRGEGEIPLMRFVDALAGKGSLEGIPGLCTRDGDDFLIQPSSEMLSIDELEDLPEPAYDLLPPKVYETISIESARGCKFRCTFCSTKFRGSWRGISAECFVDRVESLGKYLDKSLHGIYSFVDDLYTLDLERVHRITALLEERGMRVQATLDARATDIIRGNISEALVPITNHMLIGAECGYDEGLRRIRKGCTTAVLEQAAKILHSVGLAPRTVFSFVIGFPFETRDDCMKTIEFASNLMVKYGIRTYLQWFNTIPGSTIWEELREEGSLDISMYDDFGFFVNEHLFKAGVRMSIDEIREISEVVQSINSVFVLTRKNQDVCQFSAPDWLWHEPTTNFPSHGYLDDEGKRPVT